PQGHPRLGRAGAVGAWMQAREPPAIERDRDDDDAQRDQCAQRHARAMAAVVPPRLHECPETLDLDRHRAEDVRPEQRIERARCAREQLAGVERMALLRDTLAQLIDPYREHARLFQLAVELDDALRG